MIVAAGKCKHKTGANLQSRTIAYDGLWKPATRKLCVGHGLLATQVVVIVPVSWLELPLFEWASELGLPLLSNRFCRCLSDGSSYKSMSDNAYWLMASPSSFMVKAGFLHRWPQSCIVFGSGRLSMRSNSMCVFP